MAERLVVTQEVGGSSPPAPVFLGETMALYIFECNACGRVAEVLQSFADKWPDCKVCGKQMKKKPALTSFTLKGNGWARDNYGLKKS